MGSLVGGRLGYVEHLKGQFLSHTLYGHQTFHFVLSRGSVRELLGPIPPPVSGGKEADCPGSVCHPQTSILLVQPQYKTEYRINSPRKRCHGLSISGNTLEMVSIELEPLGLRWRWDE